MAAWMDTLDSSNPGAGWWSEQNGTAHPDADGLETGIMHGNWDPSEPGYYDTYTDAVLTIALVEDEIGLGGSITYTDITLDVVGKVAGDVNLGRLCHPGRPGHRQREHGFDRRALGNGRRRRRYRR